LALRKHIGGGSRWRTHLVLFGILSVLLLTLYYQLRQDVPVAYRPYVFVLVACFTLAFVFWKQYRNRTRRYAVTRIEVTTTDFAILGADSKVTMPWSAFSDCLESPHLFVLVNRHKGMLFVLPKRAFPSESWQNWFRERANNRPPPALPSPMDAPVAAFSRNADQIALNFRLAYRDYLDLTLASWFTWGIVIFVEALFLGTFLNAARHPDPNAVYSETRIFLMFVLPFLLIIAVMAILIGSIQNWRAHAKYLVPQAVAISEDSIRLASRDGTGFVPWTTYKCYKETPWSFILWKGYRLPWLILPKRAFASPDGVRLCRALLSRHLRSSRWFFG